MTDSLRYLTSDDRRRLAALAGQRHYAPGQTILAEGETRYPLFFLRGGVAAVQRRHGEHLLEVARLVAGEVFGEMGFIENTPASATVAAAEPCDVDMMDAMQVRALMEDDPGFYGRFYHSLADILSRRLRETTEVGFAEHAWGGRLLNEPESRKGPWQGGSPLRDGLSTQRGSG